ncbi:hypothetical protein GCM10027046_33440 [Uliginosibacterium flavum]|uniref:Site-specific integrase n=1 Tax=Uliginosibacterium flavum TaxID=1396831 RepID=A0ABV2TPU8_9RHOO
MAVKPYKEGSAWSFRLRIQGEDIYRTGYTSLKEAQREADRLRESIVGNTKPHHKGPWQTSLGEALQLYASERLPAMKGARQDANRINKYLRACRLSTAKVIALCDPVIQSAQTSLYFQVLFEAPSTDRKVPASLLAHRQKQACDASHSDKIRQKIARTPVAQLQPYHLQELINAMLKDGFKPATIGLEHALLRRLFSYARKIWRWREPAQNPARGLELPQINNARSRVLTNAEWGKISQALSNSSNEMVELALTLLLETAMRVSEPLLHAAWRDVDFDRRILKLTDAKAGPREVPLSPGALEVLLKLKALQGSECTPESKILPLTYETLKAAWRRAREAAEVEDVRIHDLRHTAATRFTLELNGNLPVLKVITGHKTYSQLSRYINLNAADVARLLHDRPLTEDDAPAGLHRKDLTLVPLQQQTCSDGELPENVVRLVPRSAKGGTS